MKCLTMMKKIRNIHDLIAAQQALELEKLQLEKSLQQDWKKIRSELSGNGSSFFDELKKQYTTGLVAQGISFGAGLLARKFGGKIGSKLFNWFR